MIYCEVINYKTKVGVAFLTLNVLHLTAGIPDAPNGPKLLP